MATFTFVYGVRCQVVAESKESALQKMIALQTEEDCPCKQSDCDCIFEGNIGIWDESAIKSELDF